MIAPKHALDILTPIPLKSGGFMFGARCLACSFLVFSPIADLVLFAAGVHRALAEGRKLPRSASIARDDEEATG